MVQADANLPTFLDGRGKIGLHGKYLYADKVSFYGLGNDSQKDDRSTFTYEPTTFGATLDLEPVSYLFVGGGYTFEHVNTRGGAVRDVNRGHVRRRHGSRDRPGPAVQRRARARGHRLARVARLHDEAAGSIAWSTVSTTRRDGRPYSFDWTEAEVRQFIPILRGQLGDRVPRGRDAHQSAKGGDEVPFFMMPTLGSSKDLRRFSNRRFRDTNRMLMQGEYRWRPSKFMDMGAVLRRGQGGSATATDLGFGRAEDRVRLRRRLHGPASTALRMEAGEEQGRDQAHLLLRHFLRRGRSCDTHQCNDDADRGRARACARRPRS